MSNRLKFLFMVSCWVFQSHLIQADSSSVSYLLRQDSLGAGGGESVSASYQIQSSLSGYEGMWQSSNAGVLYSNASGFEWAIAVFNPFPATIVSQLVFYNRSGFDGQSAVINADDDQAVAIDKSALAPGETSTYDNVTSYHYGLNGLMVDILNASDPDAIGLMDFVFTTGNDHAHASWTPAPDPVDMVIRRGQGKNGSDRITFVWLDHVENGTADPNEAVLGAWLGIRVKANLHTGLEHDSLFFFGNAVGKTPGDADFFVSAKDELRIRSHPRDIFNPAPIDFGYDVNRDGKVNATDQLLARSHGTGLFTGLRVITPTDSEE